MHVAALIMQATQAGDKGRYLHAVSICCRYKLYLLLICRPSTDQGVKRIGSGSRVRDSWPPFQLRAHSSAAAKSTTCRAVCCVECVQSRIWPARWALSQPQTDIQAATSLFPAAHSRDRTESHSVTHSLTLTHTRPTHWQHTTAQPCLPPPRLALLRPPPPPPPPLARP